jgi:hypothetical protein
MSAQREGQLRCLAYHLARAEVVCRKLVQTLARRSGSWRMFRQLYLIDYQHEAVHSCIIYNALVPSDFIAPPRYWQ